MPKTSVPHLPAPSFGFRRGARLRMALGVRLLGTVLATMAFGSPLGAENPPPPRLTADDRALTEWIHGRISSTPLPSEKSMEAYEGIIPRSGVKYRMVAIPAGEFTMGSPESEPSRKSDEGPPRAVTVGPFWMGAHEVTWDEYLPFQEAVGDRFRNGSLKTVAPETQPVDLVSSPTIPYTSMDFDMGLDGYPAISMTIHAALKYCQWLSAQTGHFYRLPTEAEWEYACRAGSRTAYHFGDDPGPLSDYAWYYENSGQGYKEPQYHKVGLKKPNPWGLHDMHGNVTEWVLDQYDPQGYGRPLADALQPWTQPSDSEWGRVVRGGSWYDDPESLRCAARRASHSRWMASDPQLPKSRWYLTDAKWVGFRLVRPLAVPSPEEMALIWNSGYPEKKPASDTSPPSTGEK